MLQVQGASTYELSFILCSFAYDCKAFINNSLFKPGDVVKLDSEFTKCSANSRVVPNIR